MDTYLPAKWRHRFASYADDIAAGADALEELFELLKARIECFDKAGIQVKASKLIFGAREISFHNYTISKEQTRPKDENLCPIPNMSTPRSVTELKAFLGCTQQMSQYCRYYGIVASPLHRLTRVVAGVDFDEESLGRVFVPEKQGLVQHHRFDSVKRYVVIGSRKPLLGKRVKGGGHVRINTPNPNLATLRTKADIYMLMSKLPKRVVEWVSKA
jgi:hypothetical protein